MSSHHPNEVAIITVLTEMLRDRGHTAPIQKITLVDDSDHMTFVVDDYGTIFLICATPKVGITKCRECLEQCTTNTLMFISEKGPTLETKFHFKVVAPHLHVEHFLCSELLCNPTKHALVPPHTLATDDEIEQLKQKFVLSKNLKDKLPRLLSTDIVCRYYNFPPKSIVKIRRCLGLMNPEIYFRIVT
tara:strand:- start:22220 stop:22783 length:564 start_codon:yes stop_codon:yes gene_type:complete